MNNSYQNAIGGKWRGYFLTAYGIAVKHGFTGTEEEWLRSLKGEEGEKGDPFKYEDLTEEQIAALKSGVADVFLAEAEAIKSEIENMKNDAEEAKTDAETIKKETETIFNAANDAAGEAGAKASAATAQAVRAETAAAKARTNSDEAKNAADKAIAAATDCDDYASFSSTYEAKAEAHAERAEEAEKRVAETEQNIKNSYSNAVKGDLLGAAVAAVDVSPIEHDLAVRVKSKNLINNTLSSQEINGLTVTVNEDKSVTVNGTATAKTYLSICELPRLSTDKAYFLSGGMEGNSSGTACLYIFSSALPDGTREYYYDHGGEGKALKLTEGLTYTVRILVAAGYTCEGLTFYPQLEEGTAKTEYMPYVEVEGTAVKRYGKNLLPYPYADTTKTVGDVTFTDNGDGSITVNGTTGDSSISFQLVSKPTLPIGTYSISGGYDSDSSKITILGRKNGASWIETSLTTLATGKLEKGDSIDYLAIYLPKNQTYNNVRIYPQLELGDAPTEYEPYSEPVEAVADAEGNVELKSLTPSMTLISDNQDAVIECEYNRDLMKVIDELTQAIISLGGNI